MAPPTTEQYSKYQQAWTWFNKELFGGALKPCLLNFSRHRCSYGFFAPSRWRNDNSTTHEISLNPDCLGRPLEEVMSTLVHEMVHQWQQDHGTPPRRCYHDREWAAKMVEIGLIPSDTGQPGGKPVGQRMSHYIDQKGKFLAALTKMPRAYALPWISESNETVAKPKKARAKKIKFMCPGCGTAIWSEKDDLNVACGDCGDVFIGPSVSSSEKEISNAAF